MADAVHEILPGETITLRQITALYYAVSRPNGSLEPGRVARVAKAIRVRTGKALECVKDVAPIPAGTVLKIPTFRDIPRAILCDDPVLKAALMAAGYDHANKLLQRSLTSVVDLLGPYEGKPYGAADVTRAYALTSFLDLDAVDTRSAIHLYDNARVRTLAELATQSEATIQRILDTLVAGGRPPALATSGHAARWRTSALIHRRKRFSKRLKDQSFRIPFPSRQAVARAEHYEQFRRDDSKTAEDRTLARRLALLHRFQANVIDGNFYALSKRWDRAAASHMAARKLFHRLAEDLGAATNVNDEAGVGLDIAINTAYRMLKAIPPDNEMPLGAPPLRTTFDDSSRPYRMVTDAEAHDGKSILLPSADPEEPPVRVRLNSASFGDDYRSAFLNPQLSGTPTGSVLIANTAWVDPGAFAAIVPILYGGPVRKTLGRSFSEQGLVELSNRFSSPFFDLIAADGSVVRPWSGMDLYIRDVDLGTCSTDFVDPDGDGWGIFIEDMSAWAMPLGVYCPNRLAEADHLYRQNRREEASAVYADVICAIENHWTATDQQYLAQDAQTAFAAVSNAAFTLARGGTVDGPYRAASQLTLLSTAYEDGTPVAEGKVITAGYAKDPMTFEQKVDAAKGWFSFESPGGPKMQSLAPVSVNTSIAGAAVAAGGVVTAFVDATLIDAFYFDYLYAQAKFQAIANGLNWFGFPDSFVPPWSFEYLSQLADDLTGKAVDAERQVFQMEQLYEQAAEKEFLAGQALELAEQQIAVADARVAQAEAASVMSAQQAALTVEQAQATAEQSAFQAGMQFDYGEVQPTLVEDPATGELVDYYDAAYPDSAPSDIEDLGSGGPGALFLQTLSSVPFIGGLFSTLSSQVSAQADYVDNLEILEHAKGLAAASEAASAAAVAVACAERDVTQTMVNQAADYLGFLQDQTLNSEALDQLVALSAEVHGIYQYQAHRMCWLTQQAAKYESRRTFTFIGWDYETGEELRDMMSSEFLRADLDTLRAEYTAGQSLRMQQLKWTLPLSRLDPAALASLRTRGSCVFVLRQEWVDREFPGTFLHRLKDLQLSVIGLLPPGGARGVLSMSGISWVRVPNTGDYGTGETKPDWTTDALAGSDTPYDNYVMKRLDGVPADVNLSEFNVVGDGAVLSVPRGMLPPFENLGLENAWTLSLPQRSNGFVLENIRDLELTFWFLGCYDPLLRAAQDTALNAIGEAGGLSSSARLSAAAGIPDQLAALRALVSTPDQVENRYLTWQLFGLPRHETERVVTNLRALCARRIGTTDELTFRVLADSAPAGVRVTSEEGAAHSFIDVPTVDDPDPPTENTALRGWLLDEFYSGSPAEPTEDPQQRWVVKFCPENVGVAWEARDEDGLGVLSDSGPLTGGGGGLAVHDGGADWTSYRVNLNLRKNGGRAHLLVRYDAAGGGSGYLLSIGSQATNNVELRKLTAGSSTVLAQASIPYADDEYLAVGFWVFGDGTSTTLGASVDRITILEAVDGTSPHTRGTVALRVAAVGNADVAFDDLQVVRLTQLGAPREVVLSEPFTANLPEDWTFTDGQTPWGISNTRHKRLDLVKLLNVVLRIDYKFTVALGVNAQP